MSSENIDGEPAPVADDKKSYLTSSSSSSTSSSSSEDLSYVMESFSKEAFKYEQHAYIVERQSILTPEDSAMRLLTVRSMSSIKTEAEDEYYPDIFDAKIDETEVFITDEVVPSPIDDYERDCKKYMQPPITLVKTALEGGRHLNLSRYMPDTINLHFIFKAIVAMPKNNITHLDLSRNPFEPDACNMLSELLRQNSSIVYLNLERCGIGLRGAEILAEGIEFSQSVLYLNLSRCDLRDSGGAMIAKAITNNCSVKALNLSRNFLHVETAAEIQNMLKENQTLESLNIEWNDLYPEKESSVKIMKGLRKNPSLKFLDMSWNGLCGKRFATALSGVMRVNKSMKVLVLKHNYLSNREIPSICNGITKSQSLSRLKVGGNCFTEEDIKQLIDAAFASTRVHSIDLGQYTYLSEFLYQRALEFNRIARHKYHNPEGIVFGGKLLPNPPDEVDFKAIIADRAKFLAMKPKRKKLKRNIGHFMLSLREHPEEYIKEGDFRALLAGFKAKIDEDLVDHFVKEYREKIKIGKRKAKRTAIKKMAEYYLARHPTNPPPPPPPPKPRKPKLKPKKPEDSKKEKKETKDKKKKTKAAKKKK